MASIYDLKEFIISISYNYITFETFACILLKLWNKTIILLTRTYSLRKTLLHLFIFKKQSLSILSTGKYYKLIYHTVRSIFVQINSENLMSCKSEVITFVILAESAGLFPNITTSNKVLEQTHFEVLQSLTFSVSTLNFVKLVLWK